MAKRSEKQVRKLSRIARKRRRKTKDVELQFESLEHRKVLNAVPFVSHDLDFVTALNTTLTISSSTEGVLDNDFDAEGSTLTATKATDPTDGTLTFNSNGTFTYVPDTGFEGVDTFTYTVSDGTSSSVEGTVQITVGDGLTGPLLGNQRGNSLLHDGILNLSQPIGSGLELAYSSATIPVVLVPVETIIASGTTIPDSITANLTIDGVSSGDVTFSNTGLTSGEPLRFVLRSLTTTSSTGMYDWSMDVDLEYSGSTLTRTFTGSQAIVNRVGTEFGTGWWLSGLDRIYDQTDGALLVRGNGSTLWFEKSGGSYLGAEGDLDYTTLVKNTGGDFTLTDKWGDSQEFDSNGYLTSIQALNNSVASFTFTYDGSNRIQKITDEFSREFTFTYDGGGKLSSINDFFGNDSSFTVTSGNLTEVTLTDETASGYTAPEWSYGYTTIGGKSYLNEVTDPANDVTEYLYTLSTRRLKQINNPDHTTGDPSSWKIYPTMGQGYAAGTGNTMLKVADMDARYIDEEGNTFKFETDRFGNTTQFTNATGDVTTYEYDDQSLLFRQTEADPDGAGAQTSPVTEFGYNSSGDAVYTEYPDSTTTTATYHSTLHLVTEFIDENGEDVDYTYQSDGDLATYTDQDGSVWTYTYDTHGNLLTETSPDPDGAGTKYSSIVTTYSYDSTYHNRMTKVTWDNGDYQEYTYTSSDLVATFKDELGNTTSYEYDPLGQVTKKTLPDPDGAGSETSPVFTYTYTVDLQLDTETDPLGNVTDHDYNSRGWLTKTRLPDPDGAGALARPEYTYTYDKTGRRLTETRPEFDGVSVSYDYDANGRVIEVSGPVANQDTTYSYDNLGRTTSMTDASGRTVNYEYDSRGRMTKVIDHDPDGAGAETGPTTLYDYDDVGRKTKVTDALGRETTYAYYATGWLKTTTRPDPDGAGADAAPTTTYDYDKLGRVIKVTDPADRYSENEYDIFGRLTKFIDVDPDDTGPADAPETEYAYDKTGRLTSVTDAMDFVTSYAYDNVGRVTSMTLPDPDGSGSQSSPVYSFTYDAAGNVLTETNPLSWVTSFTYDDLNRMLTVTEPDPDGAGSQTSPVWTYTYNDETLLATIKDPLNRTTTYGYDSAGRTTSVTDPLSKVTSYTYDLMDRVTERELPDPDGAGTLTPSTTTYTYDIYSRLIETEDANGDSVTRTYDRAGQRTSLTDGAGNVTQWAYDDLGRMTMETDELGYTESYYYNVLDRMVAQVDRESRTILYGFDGHKKEELWFEHASGTTPRVTVATTTQGATGVNEVQTITLTDATSGNFRLAFEGQTTDPIVYNAAASVVETALEGLDSIDNVSVTLSSGVYTVTFQGDLAATNVTSIHGDLRLDSDGTESSKITYEYDDNFRLIAIDDSWADYTYTLDNLGRVTETSESIAGFTSVIYLDNVYDAMNNLTSRTVDLGTGFFGSKDYENTYTYDRLNRLTRVDQTNQSGGNSVADKRVNYTYNSLSQVTYEQRYENLTGTGEALRTKFSYDGANRLSEIQHRHVENTSTSHVLSEYDYSYDDMGRITQIDSSEDGVSDFTYDKASQLTDADHATGRTDEAYTYDASGNRTGGDYVVSDKNRTDESTGYEYDYDRNGNRIKRLKTSDNSYETYEYDHRNRLTKVEFYNSLDVLQSTIDYAYDANNRMVRRTYDADGPGGSSAVDQFFAAFDGINATLEFDGTGKDDVSHRYLWGTGPDNLLSDEQVTSTSSDGDVLWALDDQVGTIRDIGEWNGTSTEFEIANHREYDSFGNLVSETDSSVDLAFGFNGKWTEEQTGYTHHQNRWLDPVIGKWLSEDPIGFAAGDANINRFVGNKVLTHTDPDGLLEFEVDSVVTTGGQGVQEEQKKQEQEKDKPKRTDRWSEEGVRDIIGDNDLLNQEVTIIRFTDGYDHWEDKKTGDREWKKIPGLLGNTKKADKEIRIRDDLTNDEAAETLIHELEHLKRKQATTREEGLQEEIDVRIATEQWAIDNKRPPTGRDYRTDDGKVNKKVIEDGIRGSRHYNPTTRKRIGRKYTGERIEFKVKPPKKTKPKTNNRMSAEELGKILRHNPKFGSYPF